jgi:CheY-like chemotaxis protein
LIKADPGQVSQVILNLIMNAADALEDKAGEIRISTALRQYSSDELGDTVGNPLLSSGHYVSLEVADTGSGIDPRIKNRIFEPFFSTKFAGRGLGLSAVLGAVRAVDGAIKITSTPGGGTTFTVLFPLFAASDETVHQDTAGGERGSLRAGTVLVVDDEPVVRSVACRLLRRLGLECLTAEDGLQAIEIYRERGDDISMILLDLTMPHMDGRETLKELRALNPDARVILSSGYSSIDVMPSLEDERPNGFIQKPYTEAALERALVSAQGCEPDS